MHRILILLCALLFGTVAHADYLSQSEMLDVLKRGGTTPQAMGMIPLRVCYVEGERPGGPSMRYPRQITSDTIYKRLQEQANMFNRLQPLLTWQVRCVREWHQVTPQLRRGLKPSMVLETAPSAEVPSRQPGVLRTVNAPWEQLSPRQQTLVRECRLLWNNQRIKGCTYE